MPGDLSPTTDVLDDALFDHAAVEAILSGQRPEGGGFDAVVEFASGVTALSDGPVPRPNTSLAAVLSAGFSTDKGDLPATAASNVHGPAPQVAGLPKWRNRPSMLPVPFLSGLAKIVAGVVAGLAGVTAVGAAGALPGPAQDAVAGVVDTVTPFNLPTDDNSVGLGAEMTSQPSVGLGLSTGGATTTAAAGTADAGSGGGTNASLTAGGTTPAGGGAAAGASGTAALTTPSVPGLPGLPGLGNLSGLPNLSNLPVHVPACVTEIVDLDTGEPTVPLSRISTRVVDCVKSLLATSGAQLPAGVSQCVSSILGMVGNVSPGSVPDVTGLDWSTCVPFDVTECMTSMMNLWKSFVPTGTGGAGFPGLGMASGLDFEGCVPFNLDACLSSIFEMAGNLPGVGTGAIPGLGAGTVPSAGDLDLSACVPFGSLGSIPGFGALSSFLPR